MTSYVCVTCGTQYPPAEKSPVHCPICEDERQYVRLNGQEWISLDELRKAHRNVLFEEGKGCREFITQPKFAIGQRALLLETAQGGFLWDCVSLIDEETVKLVQGHGGIRAIAISPGTITPAWSSGAGRSRHSDLPARSRPAVGAASGSGD